MEPKRALNAHNGNAEAKNRALEVLQTSGSTTHQFDAEQDTDPVPH